jgi:heme/copper-type cytochrome/quinol oxidase subunit 2
MIYYTYKRYERKRKILYYFKDKDMKYFAWAITILVVLIVGCLIWFSTLKPSTSSDVYSLTCEVIEVNRTNDTVLVIDATGNEWEWTGTEDWEIGDCASMVMNDNGTDEVYDDVIISVRYNAWRLN